MFLATASSYLPNSPRLHLRLAEFHAPYGNDDLKTAEFHAYRAAHLSPNDDRPLLALAAVYEYKEDLPAAEGARAPHSVWPPATSKPIGGWELSFFSVANWNPSASCELPPGTRHICKPRSTWFGAPSGENPATLNALVPKAQLELVRFLFEKSRVPESAAVFRQIERDEVLADRESSSDPEWSYRRRSHGHRP